MDYSRSSDKPELIQYDRVIPLHACRHWPHVFSFWPTWHAVSAPSHPPHSSTHTSFVCSLARYHCTQLCVELYIQALSCWWPMQPGHIVLSKHSSNGSYPILSDSMRTWVLSRRNLCINQQWQLQKPICMVKRVSLYLMDVNLVR